MIHLANYKYHGKNINNLGDHAQVLTIDYLYSLMGIPRDEIIYIDINDLHSYDGPPVKIPVSLPLINYSEHGVAGMFSDKITPVFFGMTMPKKSLLPEEIEYYKQHEPIGCRDEQAYNTMCKYGISAYLGGCLTVTLPKRKASPETQNKIFIVDVPDHVKKYIPQTIKDNAIWDTHIFYGPLENPTEVAAQRYQKYRDEAKLMITGLLHGAVPCMAFGIPVILARDYMSYRFAWLESVLNIYTEEEYPNINWSPAPVEMENIKQLVRDLFFKRMMDQDASKEMAKIHSIYMNRPKHEYIVDVFITIKQFIDKTWIDKEKEYEYAVWGLTQMAEITIDYISECYPNAKLTHVYDKRPGLCLRGISAISPDNIVNYPNETVFVTTVGAAEVAEDYFKQIGKPDNLYNILKIIR